MSKFFERKQRKIFFWPECPFKATLILIADPKFGGFTPSIRFSTAFFRFCFSMKKYSLFLPHFCESKSAIKINRYFLLIKILFKKFRVLAMRAIFRNRAVLLYKKTVWKTVFQSVIIWLEQIWTYKYINEKYFLMKKNGQKRKKDRYCVKLP